MSVHGPTKGLPRGHEDLLAEILWPLPRHVDGVVVHPDVIGRWEPLALLAESLLIENLDARKTSGRTVTELEEVFALVPDAGFCFDIAHAASVDPSMVLAEELLSAFGDRLRQVHLSSVDAAGHHVPLRQQDEELYVALLWQCQHVPWILEAPLPSECE